MPSGSLKAVEIDLISTAFNITGLLQYYHFTPTAVLTSKALNELTIATFRITNFYVHVPSRFLLAGYLAKNGASLPIMALITIQPAMVNKASLGLCIIGIFQLNICVMVANNAIVPKM